MLAAPPPEGADEHAEGASGGDGGRHQRHGVSCQHQFSKKKDTSQTHKHPNIFLSVCFFSDTNVVGHSDLHTYVIAIYTDLMYSLKLYFLLINYVIA